MCKEPQNSKIVVDNDDLGYQDYIDYRKTLCKSIDSSSSLYIKHIIFIIGGSLVLSLNLISASNEGIGFSLCQKLSLCYSWILLGASLVLIIYALLTTYFAGLQQLTEIDEKYKNNESIYNLESPKNPFIKTCTSLSYYCFVIGLALLIFFSIIYLGGISK